MKYIRAFFDFWRKFIVGDDSRIAIVIMWVLLFVKSLSENFVNGWFVVPVAVVLLFIYLTYSAMKRQTNMGTISIFWAGFVPMIIVVALPSLFFRIGVGTTDMQFTFIPVSICIVIGAVMTILFTNLLSRFLLLSLFLFGCLGLGLMTVWQAFINSLSHTIAHDYTIYATVLSPLIVLGFFATCIALLVKQRTKVSTGN